MRAVGVRVVGGSWARRGQGSFGEHRCRRGCDRRPREPAADPASFRTGRRQAVLGIARRLVELVFVGRRSDAANAAEILVLRHELALLRRHVAQPSLGTADRIVLATLAKHLPREGSGSLIVRPETIRRWHPALVARRWTYRRPALCRPPTSTNILRGANTSAGRAGEP